MKLASAVVSLALAAPASAVTVDFADKPLPPNSYVNNSYGFTSNGASFNNNFVDYGGGFSGWNGFSLSNVNDTTTAGFGNQYAAFAGTDVSGGGTYAVAYPRAFVDLPAGERAASVRLTNTTYAALSMRDGDSFAKKFGGASGNDPDFFSVTLTGYAATGASGAATGSATFFLADYRFANNSLDYIVSDWATLDLSGLGNARSIGVGFASSDVGSFGINTPSYVAIDNLALVPEPAILAAIGLPLLAVRRRRAR